MKEKANPLDNRYMLEMSVKKGKRIHFVDYRPSKKMLRHHNAVGSLVDMHIHTHGGRSSGSNALLKPLYPETDDYRLGHMA